MSHVRIGWERIRLGEVLAVKHGFAFKGAHFSDAGDYLVLTPGHFRQGGGIKFRGDREKYYTADFPPEFLLSQDDLVIVMTDLKQEAPILGSPAVIPADGLFLHNQRLGKVIDLDDRRIDRRYLYYLFCADSTRAQLRATATGATVRHTAPKRIYEVLVDLPPIPTQRLAGAILSAYDELIENNTRRIQILEEIAQAVYREWFVEFRYPGHGEVPLVDSDYGPIPERWGVRQLRDVAELAYGRALKADDRRGGSVAVYGSGGVVGWHDTALVEGPGVVVGRKGNVGSVYWSDGPFFPIDTTYYVKTGLPLTFIYFALRDLAFVDSHAAVPGLSRDQAYGLPFVVPSAEVCDRFDEIIAPMFALRRALLGATEKLRATRGLLLPRLISGEVDVSDLDIDLGDAAA